MEKKELNKDLEIISDFQLIEVKGGQGDTQERAIKACSGCCSLLGGGGSASSSID